MEKLARGLVGLVSDVTKTEEQQDEERSLLSTRNKRKGHSTTFITSTRKMVMPTKQVITSACALALFYRNLFRRRRRGIRFQYPGQ